MDVRPLVGGTLTRELDGVAPERLKTTSTQMHDIYWVHGERGQARIKLETTPRGTGQSILGDTDKAHREANLVVHFLPSGVRASTLLHRVVRQSGRRTLAG